MKRDCLSISECQDVVRRSDMQENQFELVRAADMLMHRCETDSAVTIEDGLACIDRGGVVAEMGARILYLITGRDGLGWEHPGYNGIEFYVDKQNWLDWLESHRE